ncbi:response regulator transcription factor [Trinickia dinghuensis]|uniref:response regulator transcription factor n=1 Tax=Trinickia dinghuensis TaxID=2291023 RepID=UPI0015F18D64|nr:response regulator transcription factor [Trinickia dinghuensis]
MNYVILTKDASLARRVEDGLVLCGASGEVFANEIEMLRTLRHKPYDLIVMDARTTKVASSALMSWRECHSLQNTPLLVVGSFADPASLFQWYEAGATDILSLQFDANEFYVRAAHALLRSAGAVNRESERLCVGPYTLTKACCVVELRGKSIQLTPREFATAWLFFTNAGVSLTRAMVAKSIWGSETDRADRTIEQHIYKLRRKLAFGAGNGVMLRTVYSLGYRLEVSGSEQMGHARFDGGSARLPLSMHAGEAARA